MPKLHAMAVQGLVHISPGLGICPAENEPKCWDAVLTCRRCCDLRRGPRGDESCWSGVIDYDACCARQVLLFKPPNEDEFAICLNTAAWLNAGRNPLTMDRADLLSVYHQVAACTAVENVLHLALLLPILQGGQPSWMEEGAMHEAEGILQWFIDSLMAMSASLTTQGYSVFFLIHRIVLAVTARRGHGPAARAAPEAELPGIAAHGGRDGAALAVAAHLASIRRSLLQGAPFEPAAADGLLASATAAFGSNLSAGPNAAAPLPCSLEAATALAAHADVARLSDGAQSSTFFAALRAVQECLDDVTTRSGPLLKLLMRRDAPPLLLVLDRLECKPEVMVSLEDDPFIHASSQAIRSQFQMSLLPVRDWESDFVRGYRDLHCGETIRELVQRRAPWDRGGIFVDVGANIGGCAIWAAHFMNGLQVMAVEPHGAAVKALNKTVQRIGLAGRVTVVQACVRHEGRRMQLRKVLPSDYDSWSKLQVTWKLEERTSAGDVDSYATSASTEIVPCRRLDELLSQRVAVLRVHTSGTEVSALASAAGLMRRGLLGAVALQFPSLAQARLLWQFGLDIELAGRNLPRGDEAAFEALRQDPATDFHAVLVGVDGSRFETAVT